MDHPPLYLYARHGLRPDSMHVECIGDAPHRVPQKIVDKLPWWLDCVLQGDMTVQEAATAYGEQTAGAGRPRRFATFADYIADRIQYAENPAVASDLCALLTRASCGGWHVQAKSAATARINRMLAETGRDRAARLRELLAQLAEPAD